MIKEKEEWRDVKGFPGYKINKKGDVVSLKNGDPKKLSVLLSRKGYPTVGLHRGRKTERRTVHKLVMEAYGTPKPGDDYQIDHVDCNKLNNDISNLEWVTGAENMRRARKNGLYKNTYVLNDNDRKKALLSVEKKIIGFNCVTGKTCEFRSVSSASRELNIPRHRIASVLDYRTMYADEWMFDYAEEGWL